MSFLDKEQEYDGILYRRMLVSRIRFCCHLLVWGIIWGTFSLWKVWHISQGSSRMHVFPQVDWLLNGGWKSFIIFNALGVLYLYVTIFELKPIERRIASRKPGRRGVRKA
ncbi:hypothetical protein dsx2_0249 [Desulfovibrio sp. X2]|uniref:hypothetical protein n=1 Tax=Desulfovibrio sp. X2 TaxID=941449 RepID=UPI000358A04A|nr:hypothetical protein [Desulfovibrio sp. X2]EPR42322.1 hypothetical protein dsx2_0249 [Desulfovibrio sp. X2]